MIAEYNRRSLAWGLPGLGLQVASAVLLTPYANQPATAVVAQLAHLVAAGLLMVGFAYYAMAKGRSPAWCMLGLVWCVGIIALALLEDRSDPRMGPRLGVITDGDGDDYDYEIDDHGRPVRRAGPPRRRGAGRPRTAPQRREPALGDAAGVAGAAEQPRSSSDDPEEVPRDDRDLDVPLVIACPHCGVVAQGTERLRGKELKCRRCQRPFKAG